MIVPIGVGEQELHRVTKNTDGTISDEILVPVKYVPLGSVENQRMDMRSDF